MKKEKFKDILVRAIKTFIQGFLGSLAVFIGGNANFDEKLIESALIGALAGGISALMNFVVTLLDKEEK